MSPLWEVFYLIHNWRKRVYRNVDHASLPVAILSGEDKDLLWLHSSSLYNSKYKYNYKYKYKYNPNTITNTNTGKEALACCNRRLGTWLHSSPLYTNNHDQTIIVTNLDDVLSRKPPGLNPVTPKTLIKEPPKEPSKIPLKVPLRVPERYPDRAALRNDDYSESVEMLFFVK